MAKAELHPIGYSILSAAHDERREGTRYRLCQLCASPTEIESMRRDVSFTEIWQARPGSMECDRCRRTIANLDKK